MKILYSQIKKMIPSLKASPQEVGNVLTMIGFMMDGLEEVNYQGNKDFIISLEIRQNRADCLSVIGLAREVAAYYGLSIKLPEVSSLVFEKHKLDIGVDVKNYVKRILAIRIANLENKESPEWLKEFLSFYEINSINLLVDLSNYVMLITGYPSHLIDADSVEGKIFWSINKEFSKIITLDGSDIVLKKDDELIIRDSKNILALAGIVGGEVAKINLTSRSVVVEMAVYDRSIIRRNSRSLKIVTEASHRLEKDLDPNGSEYAINLLVSLILESCGGKIDSEFFDYYPKKQVSSDIAFNLKSPTIYAGINISEEKTLDIFKNLNFKINNSVDGLIVTPPTYRMDISIPEDLIEEVIRMVNYEKIPSDEIPKIQATKDITPKNIYLSEMLRDILVVLGFDEILSLPLTKKGDNLIMNYLNWEVISTQNSVNEVFPDLRQTMAIGLLNQLNDYLKKNIEYIKIFEIGKVFGKQEESYKEQENLGILMQSSSSVEGISSMKETVERVLRSIGFEDIKYVDAKNKPQIANPYSCWDIFIKDKNIGIIYKLKPQDQSGSQSIYFAEIKIEEVVVLLDDLNNNPTVELIQKLIILDANVEILKKDSIDDYLDEIKKKINPENLWSIVIKDKFELIEKSKYTVHVSYYGLSDQDAKKLHMKVFGLTH